MLYQKPLVTDLWYANATLRVVFEHPQNSTIDTQLPVTDEWNYGV